ncbi:MAG: 50S ribosomal protein L35, partial [Chlorobiota bacterium]
AKKRYKVTATGKIVREKAYRSHILTSKDRKRKRSLRNATLVDRANLALVRAQLLLG